MDNIKELCKAKEKKKKKSLNRTILGPRPMDVDGNKKAHKVVEEAEQGLLEGNPPHGYEGATEGGCHG